MQRLVRQSLARSSCLLSASLTGGTGWLLEGPCGNFPGGSALLAPIPGFPHLSASPVPSQHTNSSLGEMGHKTHPWACMDGEVG